jgi:hypothetical protein
MSHAATPLSKEGLALRASESKLIFSMTSKVLVQKSLGAEF